VQQTPALSSNGAAANDGSVTHLLLAAATSAKRYASPFQPLLVAIHADIIIIIIIINTFV